MDKIDGTLIYMEVAFMFTYMNILLDIYIAIFFRCYGSNCASVTQNNSPQHIITNEELKKVLEVHILTAMVISNLVIHVFFTPIVVYIWNKLKAKYFKCKWCP